MCQQPPSAAYSTSAKPELTFCSGYILLEKDLLLWSWKHLLQAEPKEIVVYQVRHEQRNHYFRFWWIGCWGKVCETGSKTLNIVDFALQEIHGSPKQQNLCQGPVVYSGSNWCNWAYSQYNSCKGSQGQACSALLYQTWLNPAGRKNRMSPFPAPALQLNVLPCGARTRALRNPAAPGAQRMHRWEAANLSSGICKGAKKSQNHGGKHSPEPAAW